MRTSTSITALVGALGFSSVAVAKDVIAHYMAGFVNPDHAATDVNNAIGVGIDAFAMNVGDPTADYPPKTIQALFDATASTNFKLFFSFDLYAHNNFADHVTLWEQFKDQPNYYKINNLPVVSTFGGYNNLQDMQNFKSSSEGIFLMPNLDDANIEQYYTNTASYLSGFNDFVDGYFSWESAWPAGQDSPANVSDSGDQTVLGYAHSGSKAYMMPLSSLQYKDLSDGTHYYRVGATNLAERMTQVLDTQPDYAEIITWNDAGESHYIGNLWTEGIPDSTGILNYANDDQWPHHAWQPLYTSFIQAFKNGASSASMAPPASDPVGALWYSGTIQSACSNPPQNGGSALDSVNYAVVVPASASGWKIQVSIDGNVLATNDASPGLNYAAVPGLASGTPKLDVLTSDGASPSYSATGSTAVDGSNVECNFNFYVAGLNPV